MVGMPVHAQYPVDVRRDLGRDLLQRSDHRRKLLLRIIAELGASRREQHLRLEHEAVADNPDIRAIAEDLAQSAEELRTIAGELLDFVDERQIKPLAELDNLPLLVLDLGFGGIESSRDARELIAQRSDLGSQLVDPGERSPADFLLRAQRLLRSRSTAAELGAGDIAGIDL